MYTAVLIIFYIQHLIQNISTCISKFCYFIYNCHVLFLLRQKTLLYLNTSKFHTDIPYIYLYYYTAFSSALINSSFFCFVSSERFLFLSYKVLLNKLRYNTYDFLVIFSLKITLSL